MAAVRFWNPSSAGADHTYLGDCPSSTGEAETTWGEVSRGALVHDSSGMPGDEMRDSMGLREEAQEAEGEWPKSS